MKRCMVILNEQHTLLPDQKRRLDEVFGDDGWETYPVPAEGWVREEIIKQAEGILRNALAWKDDHDYTVVFASPVPALLVILARHSGSERKPILGVFVFHNDKRIAKELPGGKSIHTVAPDGWEFV